MKKTKSLGAKIACIFIGVVLFIMIISGIINSHKIKDILNDNAKMISKQMLDETKKGFQRYLKTLSLPVDLMTRNNEFKKVETESLEENAKELSRILSGAVKVTDGSVRMSYALARHENLDTWTELKEDGNHRTLYEYTSGTDYSNEDWFKNCIDKEAIHTIYSYYTGFYMDEETGKEILSISQPINKEELIGVVRLDIEADKVRNYINSINIMNTGFVILLDQNGKLLVSDVENQITEELLQDTKIVEFAKGDMEDTNHQFMIDGIGYHVELTKEEITGWTIASFMGEEETKASLSEIRMTIWLFTVLGIIIAIGVAILSVKHLVAEINKVKLATLKVAEGDFTESLEVKGNDELAVLQGAVNTMIGDVSGLLKNIKSKADQMIEVSKKIDHESEMTRETVSQVSESINSVAAGAGDQAESTQEANGQVDQLSHSLEIVQQEVESITSLSENATKLSKEGIESVTELLETAKKAEETSKASISTVDVMLESIDKISSISDIIVGITEQTNLLALNASIEAARAGEAGKGFAVVADEIRKLADQSRQSTDQIKNIVEEVSSHSNQVKGAMNENQVLQEAQQEAVEATKEHFLLLEESIRKLSSGMEAIHNANNQMNDNKKLVVEHMEKVASVSEESAAAAEEVNASVEQVESNMDEILIRTRELNDIAIELQASIERFKLN
ncbi:MAG: methyl-accepting chemotaxis protein [Cellulosilyticum sp.]|nr:methyl-accepting chemotaxis protein [Cellulosilyticum sp.]